MRCFQFIFSFVLFAAQADWSNAFCPNGFLTVGSGCVEAAKNCPQNFELQNGLCQPAVVNAIAIPQGGCAQNTPNCPCPNVASGNNCPQTAASCTQPCTQVTVNVQSNTPCANTIPATPCNAVQPCNQPIAPVTACNTANQPCVNTVPATPCNAVQPCNQPIAPVTPCNTVNQPCANTVPATPCNAVQPCNQPIAPVTPCNTVNQPCVNTVPATPCNAVQPCSQPIAPIIPCNTQPPAPPPTPQTTPQPKPEPEPNTKPPPPLEIMRCPFGTVLIDGICRQIGCGKWFIYMNNKCVRVDCPHGTYWTGNECAEPPPTQFNFNFHNTIKTQINHTKPLVINNINDWNVTVVNNVVQPVGCSDDTCSDDDNNDVYDDNVPDEGEIGGPVEETKDNCCTVVTPRMCSQQIVDNEKSWKCYSRRYRRCGKFCISPTIYLTAPEPVQRDNVVVLPPKQSRFLPYQTEVPVTDSHDCAGCASGQMGTCAPYCQRYVCPTNRCQFYDQRQYCSENPGQHGCQHRDGCYSDWCSNGPQAAPYI